MTRFTEYMKNDWQEVIDSTLTCQTCYEVSDNGIINTGTNEVRWTCPVGHENKVKT